MLAGTPLAQLEAVMTFSSASHKEMLSSGRPGAQAGRRHVLSIPPDHFSQLVAGWASIALCRHGRHAFPQSGERRDALSHLPQQCNLGLSPTFSPDGRWIAFSCLLDANYDLHVLPAKGGTSKALTRVKQFPSPLAWSADSKRIVYSENGDLFEVSKDGGKPRRLVFAHDASQPAISTRGERLAYSQGKANVMLAEGFH
jgi:hypothetical protein